MIKDLPIYISLIFGLTVMATFLLFIWTVKSSSSILTRRKSTPLIFGLTIWLVIQAVLSFNNIYNTDTNSFPPKIMLVGILPAISAIIILFANSKGRQFIDSLPLKNLTYINSVRMPVELVLFWLFLNRTIPELMTFEGRNFDILAGITAPFMAYFSFTKQKISRNGILIWNYICLGLLLNIVVNALLSAPSPIQKFAFEQPNIAILNFPYILLPTFIVPIVLFGHLTSIRQLHKSSQNINVKTKTHNENSKSY